MIVVLYYIITGLIEFILFILSWAKSPTFLMALLFTLLIIILFICTLFLGNYISDWEKTIKSTYPKMTFKEFYSSFNTIPDSFELKDDWVIYYDRGNNNYIGYSTEHIVFKTFIDYCKYKLFHIQYNKQIEKEKRDERQKELMKRIQENQTKKQTQDEQEN